MSAKSYIHSDDREDRMCEHDDLDEFARRREELTRRRFGAMALGAGFFAALNLNKAPSTNIQAPEKLQAANTKL